MELKPKRTIDETYDEFKQRKFSENITTLRRFLSNSNIEDFELKKPEGRIAQLLIGGEKVLELFNEDVIFFPHVPNNDFMLSLRQAFDPKIEGDNSSEPLDTTTTTNDVTQQ